MYASCRIINRCVYRSGINKRLVRYSSGSSGNENGRSEGWWNKNDGTKELLVGGIILTGIAIDYWSTNQRHREREGLLQSFLEEKGSPKDRKEMERWASLSPLYECEVAEMPTNLQLDGYKCLTGIQPGDTVQVLEEKVGPGLAYSVCRKVDKGQQPTAGSDGWFPTLYLKKK